MSTRIAAVRIADKGVNALICLALAIVLLFGCYSIWDTWSLMNGGANGSDLTHYKPTLGEETHLSLAELAARNPDVKAWLTIDDTGIDYPVVQGKDNFEYLNLDPLGDYSLKGSLFLDYLCDPTFGSSYELIHGHHMVESMMFGDLGNFETQDFFDKHQTGYLMTVDKTYKLEIFACLHVAATDPYVYYTFNVGESSNRSMLEHIAEVAVCQRDIGVSSYDQILGMSTCASGQTSDRTIVFAKMTER